MLINFLLNKLIYISLQILSISLRVSLFVVLASASSIENRIENPLERLAGNGGSNSGIEDVYHQDPSTLDKDTLKLKSVNKDAKGNYLYNRKQAKEETYALRKEPDTYQAKSSASKTIKTRVTTVTKPGNSSVTLARKTSLSPTSLSTDKLLLVDKPVLSSNFTQTSAVSYPYSSYSGQTSYGSPSQNPYSYPSGYSSSPYKYGHSSPSTYPSSYSSYGSSSPYYSQSYPGYSSSSYPQISTGAQTNIYSGLVPQSTPNIQPYPSSGSLQSQYSRYYASLQQSQYGAGSSQVSSYSQPLTAPIQYPGYSSNLVAPVANPSALQIPTSYSYPSPQLYPMIPPSVQPTQNLCCPPTTYSPVSN